MNPLRESPNALRVEAFSTAEALDLAGANPTDQPLESRPEWFALLQEIVFANDSGVRYLVATDNGRTLAFLPIRIAKESGLRSVQALGNFYTARYAPWLDQSAGTVALQRLLGHAVSDGGITDTVRFSPLDPTSQLFDSLSRALSAMGWHPFPYFAFGNWYLKVEGSWNDYLNGRSVNLRTSIKRRTKQFSAMGGTLSLHTDLTDIDAATEAFQQVYAASWKEPEPFPRFVPSLIRMLAASGELRLGIAWLEGKPIAAQFWYVTGKTASIYKVAYHEAFAGHSPGTVLTAFLLRHVIDEDKVAEVDFLIGDDDYKKKWMSHRRERWGIVAYNARTARGLGLLIREKLQRTVKALYARLWPVADAYGHEVARTSPATPQKTSETTL